MTRISMNASWARRDAMPVVDTNLLVALMDPDHEHHALARADLKDGTVVVTWGSLQEMSEVVRRRANAAGKDGNRAGRDAVRGVMLLEGFREASVFDLGSVTTLHANEPALSFADAWSLFAALHMHEPLLTYDTKLKLAFKKRR